MWRRLLLRQYFLGVCFLATRICLKTVEKWIKGLLFTLRDWNEETGKFPNFNFTPTNFIYNEVTDKQIQDLGQQEKARLSWHNTAIKVSLG